MLAFDAGFGGLFEGLVGLSFMVWVLRYWKGGEEEGWETYRVTGSKFLLCCEYGSAALGGVECGFAFYYCFSLCASPASSGSNLRDGIPVIHCEGLYEVDDMDGGIDAEKRLFD